MNFINRIFGGSSKPPVNPQVNVPAEGPKAFFSTKVDTFNTVGGSAFISMKLEDENGAYRELVIPIPVEDLRGMIHENKVPPLDHIGTGDRRIGKPEPFSNEFKQQIFDAISHNGSILQLEGRKWTILPSKPHRG